MPAVLRKILIILNEMKFYSNHLVLNSPVNPRWKKEKLGAVIAVPALGLLGAKLLMPRQARAGSRKTILETIGASIAVGTVLGASTLPFYDQPGENLGNVLIGALVGIGVGAGILLYELIQGTPEEYTPWGRFTPGSRLMTPALLRLSELKQDPVDFPRLVPQIQPRKLAWMSLVSLNR